MSVSLAKSATAPVTLVKVADALAPLNAPRVVSRDLAANSLDALSAMFTLRDVRNLIELEDELHALDMWVPSYGIDYRSNAVLLERSIDARLDALTAGRYRSTSR